MELKRFGKSDYGAVCDFLIELSRSRRDHINWNWARFEWMYGHPSFDRSLADSIGLWWDGGRIVGAAIYDMYFGEAFCGALEDHGELYPEILRYACGELGDESGLAVAIAEDCADELAAAERLGFAETDQLETVMAIELDALTAPALPEGYSFVCLDLAKDSPREIQWMFWQGFDHGDDLREFEEDLEKTLRADLEPRIHFDPFLSVAAADRSGQKSAYCCLWYCASTDYAYVEPVCTVPAHRGKGLGKAVVLEALRRARSLGAKRAYVISDNPFYEKLGFTLFRRFFFYGNEKN